MITIRNYPSGPRVWIVGQRVHHGAAGCLLLIALLPRRQWRLAAVGALLAIHDRADLRYWFVREKVPAVTLAKQLSYPVVSDHAIERNTIT